MQYLNILRKHSDWFSLLHFNLYVFMMFSQWTQLKTRKQNLTRLFQRMQSYQFEQISADPDKPLSDSTRPLDTGDMERCVYKLVSCWT